MNLDNLNRWLTLAANVGVLAGIFFLAYELQQNTQMMKSQTRAQVSQSTIHNVDMYREAAVLAATIKLELGEQLSIEEEYLLDNAANATFRMWENNFYQYQSGLFEQSEFEAELAIWREIMSNDVIFREHWKRQKMTYSSGFRDFMDGLIGNLN